MNAIDVVERMIGETARVAYKIAVENPDSEGLNAQTGMGIRLQVLSDVKHRLVQARITELENEGARG